MMAATNLTGLNTLVHGKPFKHRLQPSTCSAVTVGCAAAAGPPHPADSAPYFPPSPPWSSTSPFIPAYWTSKPTALSPAHPSSPHSRASSLSHSFLHRGPAPQSGPCPQPTRVLVPPVPIPPLSGPTTLHCHLYVSVVRVPVNAGLCLTYICVPGTCYGGRSINL